MKISIVLSVICLGLLSLSVRAAAGEPAPSPLVGTWAATFDSNRGQIVATYVIKAEGDRLTGTASSSGFTGEGVLSAIKLDKDNVSFVETFTFDGIGLRFEYTGRLNGDELQLRRVLPSQGISQQGVAKRVKEGVPASPVAKTVPAPPESK
jgi:hypothetical protein